MAKDLIGYNRYMEEALRGVVRDVLRRAASQGMPGNHHFYLSFRTDEPGVEIPDFLRAKFPQEMTIVLQHQFWGLHVEDDGFEVLLSFSKARQRVRVPFVALTGFFDPSVQFGLQFQRDGGQGKPGVTPSAELSTRLVPAPPVPAPATEDEAAGKPVRPAEPPGGGGNGKPSSNVVTLDKFRKK
ncbi:MAG: hypothetical protein FJX68_06730 [Alphaproteobacteria bacterium]|nr:hypothetical protein [Alphaproteobacteria bacterium]